jgi:EAL and modified HD-GYP domain-containing signal transduction protein
VSTAAKRTREHPVSPPTKRDLRLITRYIARQPILTREQNTHAYELLFRSGPDNFFDSCSADAATAGTIDFSLLSFASSLTSGLPAYINCTRNILVRDVITLLPRDRVVIEVLEDVIADKEVLAACDRLHSSGYRIALDDYVRNPETARLLPFADIVKVDFLATNAARQAAIASEMRSRGIRLVAEKIETREQFELARRLGYDYFQGYFFSRPQMLSMQDVPCTNLSYLQILGLANSEDYDVQQLEAAILREPSLCYRLLRYLNSAAFGLFPVRSIRHALSLLGQHEIQKWISIVVMISIASDKPGELIASALTRARICEVLAPHCGEQAAEAFMVGVMSLMDAILDCPMDVVVSQLPLTNACKSALRGGSDRLGRLLRLSVACERVAWEEISDISAELAFDEGIVWEAFRQACEWSSKVLREKETRVM